MGFEYQKHRQELREAIDHLHSTEEIARTCRFYAWISWPILLIMIAHACVNPELGAFVSIIPWPINVWLFWKLVLPMQSRQIQHDRKRIELLRARVFAEEVAGDATASPATIDPDEVK